MTNAMHEQALADAEVLRDAGRFSEAAALYREVIAAAPTLVLAHYKLGVVLGMSEQEEEAVAAYREALRLNCNHAEAANNLGVLLRKQQKFQEAKECFIQALAEKPDYLEASMSLGSILLNERRTPEALYFYRRAVSIAPHNGKALQGLGETLRQSDRYEEAIATLREAVQADAENHFSWNSLGSCLLNLSAVEQALGYYRRAVDAAPDVLMPRKNLALAMNYIPESKADSYAAHTAVGNAARHLLAGHALPPGFAQSRDSERRLRIGFVSGDLRVHSVSYFMLGVMQALDHQNFEFHAYYTAPTTDARTREFVPLFHHWHYVHDLPAQRIAQQIRNTQIDILIDLGGYTNHSITETFVLRPAPVQISWIGYPNTSGMPEIDYRLTDAWADPVGEDDEFYSEKRYRLPACFLAYTPYDKAPPVAPPPCLVNGFITFGSFNQRVKMSAECIALWSRVLHAVPDSRLLLKSVAGMGQASVRESLIQEFSSHGITSERLDLLPSDRSTEAHLERYSGMDIALDSIPYNGTTTTCEALWMGVPVIGLSGDRHAARVSVSLLNAAGLPELLAQDEDSFVRIAVELAADRIRLESLRGSMRARLMTTPLLDSRGMARNLEQAWRVMWQDFCERDPVPAESERSASMPLQRLDIGGIERREGWVRVDIEAGEGVDVVADLCDLHMFDNGSCAEIYCSHVLQCLPSGNVLDALQEMHRILTPGGTLYLAVPDLDALAALLVDESMTEARKFEAMRVLFGMQQHDNDFSRTGINFNFLMAYLGDIGFDSAEHVESFGIFDDSSNRRIEGVLVSLNLIVIK